VAVLRPTVEGVDGGVPADEAFAVVVDEGEQVGLLLVGQVFLSESIEEDRVEVVEVFCVDGARACRRILSGAVDLVLGDQLRVGTDVGDVRPICSMVARACEIESC